jgi:hypothetical protein
MLTLWINRNKKKREMSRTGERTKHKNFWQSTANSNTKLISLGRWEARNINDQSRIGRNAYLRTFRPAQLLPLLCSPNATNKNGTSQGEGEMLSLGEEEMEPFYVQSLQGKVQRRMCNERLGRRLLWRYAVECVTSLHEPTRNRAVLRRYMTSS